MKEDDTKNNFSSFSEIFKNKKTVKPPAYPWQDLALKIITELGIPNFKKSSVFKICKELPAHVVKRAADDTKELCPGGNSWQYFFKVIDSIKKK
ncbi:MAG: hypothetical protein PHH52_00535 [Patescibacteria group bacterium]|jgi:hypothetical protein|nr:hypothetical protein [Patescibacteria group bacterium]MDD3777856.1 hypothetical protein [Patescibacteria group bacterium]MDD3939356.1 hypothetical protein [Patescibacteria group bacterium]MDD4443995.1 hypothetical protein [Patescibacteria group bacterium]NCU39440.1 hypothetical protein [Candidatus Falkowbacteria bacterium]